MKNLFTILVSVLLTVSVFAQVPQKMSYQSVIRNSSNTLVTNTVVGVRISILQGSATGTTVYTETQNPTTNSNGLITIEIGSGTVVSGNFSTIDWSNNSYFIKTEIDITNGTNYTITGTSQLLSVPYALYSEKSGSTDSSIWKTNVNNIYYNQGNVGIGEITPTGKLVVRSDSTATSDDMIFSVLNAQGDTILAVYQEGVRINVYDDPIAKANTSKGGFAVGGFSPSKGAFTNEYFRVTPDSVRIYIEESSVAKANTSKGGFAVGGFSPSKLGLTNEYLRVTNDSTRIWTEDTLTGFGVKNIGINSKTSYMQLTPNNYFIGHESGKSITTGLFNSFIGYKTGVSNTTRSNNIFIGYNVGILNTIGYQNTTLGNTALYSNTEGYDNIAIGTFALYSNITGYRNVAIGVNSLYYNISGNNNVAIGEFTLYSNLSGSSNTAVGDQSLFNNTIGEYNSAVGRNALFYNSEGSDNSAMGNSALQDNTSGNRNVAIGYQALNNNTTGNYNTANGTRSLNLNKTGNNNTALGYYAFYYGDNYSNSTAIGYNSDITASNQVRVGNSSVTSIGGQVGWTTLSDVRLKKDISENVPGLEFITKLRPVLYYLNMDAIAEFLKTPESLRIENSEKIKGSILQTGFIAQEVEDAAKQSGFDFSGVDKPKNENDYYGLRYAEFTVPIVKAVQEQQIMIEEQQTQIEELKKRIIVLESK